MKYYQRVIEQVNKEVEKSEGQKLTSKRVVIKISDIRHKRAKKSDPRLARLMFQLIYIMYQDIKNK